MIVDQQDVSKMITVKKLCSTKQKQMLENLVIIRMLPDAFVKHATSKNVKKTNVLSISKKMSAKKLQMMKRRHFPQRIMIVDQQDVSKMITVKKLCSTKQKQMLENLVIIRMLPDAFVKHATSRNVKKTNVLSISKKMNAKKLQMMKRRHFPLTIMIVDQQDVSKMITVTKLCSTKQKQIRENLVIMRMLPNAFVKLLIMENPKVASQEREEDLENTILAIAKGFSRN